MGKLAFSNLFFLFILLFVLTFTRVTLGDPRAQEIKMMCTKLLIRNTELAIANFAAATDSIAHQLQTQLHAVGFAGVAPDADYALAQCYGDLSLNDCSLCYVQARTLISKCYPYHGAMIFLDGCFLRSVNYSFFQEYTGPDDSVICGNRTRKNSSFQDTIRRAVLRTSSDASSNDGYARVEMPVSSTSKESVYVLADCWKTLSANSCRACLEKASSAVLGCLPWSEGRAMNTGCFMRYSDTNFLNPISSNSSSRRTMTIVIAATVVSSAVVIAAGVLVGAYIWNHRRIKKKRKGSQDMKMLAKALLHSSLHFKYSLLERATNKFHEGNKLGQGGFGTVYKGVLPDGREIAVKRLFFNTIQKAADFFNEVNIISSVDHKNLVRLLGCSCSGPENLLVYEFLVNKSLDGYIFDPKEGKVLNWEKRFAIVIGIAEGLLYLHEKTRIIHRDIKASNILLDRKFRAKIADFGLARSFQEDKSHVSTGIAGTLGYMAPEYIARGVLTEKADVYSFGVLLLEVVTGRQNNSTKVSEYVESLMTTAWKHFQQGTVSELVDPNLMLHNNHSFCAEDEVLRVVHVGLLCIQETPALRPSMSKALEMLANKDEDLPPPTNPPFLDERTMEITNGFESVANVSESIFYPR